MVFQLVLSDALTIQSLATIVFGGVSVAIKYLINVQICLIELVDISLRSSTMCVSLFSSAFQISRPTTSCHLQHLVCLSLVRYGASTLLPSSKYNVHFRFSGRYPWAIEDALRKYGDVVSIAPNELVFFNPQAFLGEYSVIASRSGSLTPTQIYTLRIKRTSSSLSRRTSKTMARIWVALSGKRIPFAIARWPKKSLPRSAIDQSRLWSP